MPISFDLLVFAVLPYVALVVAVIGTVERYRRHAYSCTSHSSQFLENRRHFWGIVPFHVGILVILALHVIGALVPGPILALSAKATTLPCCHYR